MTQNMGLAKKRKSRKKGRSFWDKTLSALMIFMACLIIFSVILVVFFNGNLHGIGFMSGELSDVPPPLTLPSLPQGQGDGSQQSCVKTCCIFNLDNVKEGYLLARYPTEKKVSVILEKDGKQLREDLPSGGKYTVIPLNFGDGRYSVSLCLQKEGNQYNIISSIQLSVKIEDPLKRFLLPIPISDFTEDTTAVAVARKLYTEATSSVEFTDLAFRWVTDTISYDEEMFLLASSSGYRPDLDRIVEDGKGICADYASVFAAMLRSCGIPCQIVYGDIETTTGKRYHAWNMVWLEDASGEGKWWRYDPTLGKSFMDPSRPYGLMAELLGYSRYEEAQVVR